MQRILILTVVLISGAVSAGIPVLAAETPAKDTALFGPSRELVDHPMAVHSRSQVSAFGGSRGSLNTGPTFDSALQKLQNQRGLQGKRLKGHGFEFFR